MSEPTLGLWLRRERERRGITLKTVADQTKVAAPLLDGLESGDLSRWPGGIYRRAFVKVYASALGLDPDEVLKRFELEHPPADSEPPSPALDGAQPVPAAAPVNSARSWAQPAVSGPEFISKRGRLIGTAADLTVALVLALGSAAAGSRLLWPVLLIAGYYAIGVLLTGTSPMVALLNDTPVLPPPGEGETVAAEPARASEGPRPSGERRHSARRQSRPPRTSRTARPRVQQ